MIVWFFSKFRSKMLLIKINQNYNECSKNSMDCMDHHDCVGWHWFVIIRGAWQLYHIMWRVIFHFKFLPSENHGWKPKNCNFSNVLFLHVIIALNADNLAANRIVYVAATGVVDFAGLILSMTLLKFFGRKISSCGLFALSGFFLLSLIIIPRGNYLIRNNHVFLFN